MARAKSQLRFRRKLYVFFVERYDSMRDHWMACGSVLLPDNAYRFELSNALAVFGISTPRPGDMISWSYESVTDGTLVQQRWPRVRISDVHNRPLVRLSAHRKAAERLGVDFWT